jgi:hypothetical protein
MILKNETFDFAIMISFLGEKEKRKRRYQMG